MEPLRGLPGQVEEMPLRGSIARGQDLTLYLGAGCWHWPAAYACSSREMVSGPPCCLGRQLWML